MRVFARFGIAALFMVVLPLSSPAGAHPNAPWIQYGDIGDNVVCVQFSESVTFGGSYPAIDGIFGDETYYATLDFQSYWGLSVDGVVGPETGSKVWELNSTFGLNDCYPLVPTYT